MASQLVPVNLNLSHIKNIFYFATPGAVYARAHLSAMLDFGGEIALRFPRRRARRQTTEQMGRIAHPTQRIAPLLSAARMAQRAIPTSANTSRLDFILTVK